MDTLEELALRVSALPPSELEQLLQHVAKQLRNAHNNALESLANEFINQNRDVLDELAKR